MDITMTRNEEYGGLELSFSERPDRDIRDQVKEQGFRWHNAKKVWFAKETESRVAFALRLGARDIEGKFTTQTEEKAVTATKGKPEKKPKESSTKVPNTFAAHYDAIGDAKILPSPEVSLLSRRVAYLEDIKCYYRCYSGSGDSIILTDLQNAGKAGKTCQTWSIYPASYGQSAILQLLNVEKISTCKELFEALKEGRALDSVRVQLREEKAVDVFSPFEEVKPLKSLPEKWTKRNFTQALLSGQIFRGEISYRYTDDYAMDAAYNFSEGVGLHMPSLAKDVVEDWSSLASVRTHDAEPCKDGSYSLSYSEYSNSGKTLWFDVNCDIAEGKRRAQERQAGLERYNQMMKDACITVTPEQIVPDKLYVLQQLEQDGNTGKYGTRTENIPGHRLRSRLEEGYVWDVLSVKPLEIQPDRIYELSNFHHRPDPDLLKDDRVIECGNWKCIVTGKALQEMIAEQKCLPYISTSAQEHGTFQQAEATLQQFAKGDSFFVFGNNAPDYNKSLERLRSEYARATGRKPDLDNIIGNAAVRSAAQQGTQNKEKVVPFQR